MGGKFTLNRSCQNCLFSEPSSKRFLGAAMELMQAGTLLTSLPVVVSQGWTPSRRTQEPSPPATYCPTAEGTGGLSRCVCPPTCSGFYSQRMWRSISPTSSSLLPSAPFCRRQGVLTRCAFLAAPWYPACCTARTWWSHSFSHCASLQNLRH